MIVQKTINLGEIAREIYRQYGKRGIVAFRVEKPPLFFSEDYLSDEEKNQMSSYDPETHFIVSYKDAENGVLPSISISPIEGSVFAIECSGPKEPSVQYVAQKIYEDSSIIVESFKN